MRKMLPTYTVTLLLSCTMHHVDQGRGACGSLYTHTTPKSPEGVDHSQDSILSIDIFARLGRSGWYFIKRDLRTVPALLAIDLFLDYVHRVRIRSSRLKTNFLPRMSGNRPGYHTFLWKTTCPQRRSHFICFSISLLLPFSGETTLSSSLRLRACHVQQANDLTWPDLTTQIRRFYKFWRPCDHAFVGLLSSPRCFSITYIPFLLLCYERM